MQDVDSWLERAVQPRAESRTVEVDGARVHCLRWPRAAASPPRAELLLVHGHAANAHWWDWTAPALLDRYDVAAIDLTGNGDSEHRSVYSSKLYAEEMLAVAAATGFENPVLVGHSFGGTMARIACHLHPTAFRALLLIDSALPDRRGKRAAPPMPRERVRYYTSLEQARRRFRLRPPQPAPQPSIMKHVADLAVRHDPQGYRFKLDPAIFARMTEEPDYPDAHAMLAGLAIPYGLVYGERSRFFDADVVRRVAPLFAPGRMRGVDQAHHHLFLDQPDAAVDAIRDVLDNLLDAR